MLDRNNPIPLHEQLLNILEDEIENGKWGPNEKIPSENELSSHYGISRMTVRSVLTDLVREGWLYRVQGKGTFVSDKIEALSPSYIGIREQLEQMGYQVTTKIIYCREEACSSTVAKRLHLNPGDSVCKIKRVRYTKNGPISIHISYINSKYSSVLTESLLEREQLCVILNNEYGLQRKKVVETLESVSASEEEAKLLEIQKEYPLLLLRDVIFSQDGKPFEYTKVIFRGDKIKIRLVYEA